MNTLNNLSEAFNAAALAAAKKLNPQIPDDALPIILMAAVEVPPEPNDVNFELGGDPEALEDWGGMSVGEVLREIQSRSRLMWMPAGYQGIGFAVHDGEKFGAPNWYVALKTEELPSPYDECEAPASVEVE